MALKVLFLLPDLHRGSMVRQVAALARGLTARGCEIRICAFRDGAGIDELHAADFTPTILSRGWLYDPRPYCKFIELLRSFSPDVVHFWQDEHPLVQSLVAWCSRARRIISAERATARSSLHKFLPRLRGRPPLWALPSHSLAESCTATEKVVLPPPALPSQSTGRGPDALRAELGLGPQARIILCAGRLVAANGWQDALWALDILQFVEPHASLLIAGEGPDRTGLESFARTNRLQARVRFLGWSDDLADLIRVAEIVWIPSRVDAMPLFLLEAMALGRPVIAARQPSIAEIVTDGQTGLLFPPGDKPALARQTLRLMRQRELASTLGAGGYNSAQNRQHFESWIDRHLEIYQETDQGRTSSHVREHAAAA